MSILSRFFIDTPPVNAEYGTYDYPLVFLSYLVAVFASFIAFRLVLFLIKEPNPKFQLFWQCGGAVALGSGIWAMHFVGMLSYHTNMMLEYDVGLTFLSMGVAIVFSYAVLHIVKQQSLPKKSCFWLL